jgi:hypothetical protein
MDITSIPSILNTLFLTNLDYNLTFISILFILSFYASGIIKQLLKGLRVGIVGKFLLFSMFLILGTNTVLVYLTNLVLSIPQVETRWTVIIVLFLWSFIKFDEEIAKAGRG